MKVYLRTRGSVAAQAAAYAAAFNGQVLKQYYRAATDRIATAVQATAATYDYAYVALETGEKIMIAPHQTPMPAWGYQLDIVLNYDDAARFHAAAKRLAASPHFRTDYAPKTYGWGTTITKFYDEWGYGWVLELKAAAKA